MAQNYEDVVREWYVRLRPEFLRRLTAKYSGLTLYDAENLYQDTFLAVHENIQNGRVREDTSWKSYIMTIGLNLAGKAWRDIGRTDSVNEVSEGPDDDLVSATARKVEDILKTLPSDDDETPLCRNEEALALLGNQIKHTPEPCCSIIRMFYFAKLSMEEIADEVGYRNASTAKAKKSQCMSDLIARVTSALRSAGFDVLPKGRNRNGRC